MINLYMLILSTGIMTLAVEKAMRIFFEKRKTTLPIAVLTYLLFWGAMISQYWLPILLYIFLLSLTLAVITLNYEASVIKRLLAFSGSYVILILSTAMFRFFLFILPHEMLPILGDIAYLLTIITTYLLVLLAFQRFTYIKKDMVYSNKLLLPLCFITIVDLISTALLPLNIPNHIEIYYTIVHIGITFIIFYLHNSISKSYGESIKSALHAQEKEYYFTQCQLMQASVENTKSLRHDMKLHLATAREFVSSDKTDEATAYLTGLLGNIEESGVYSNTQNTAFDSIINFKLNNAKDENIKLDIRLLIPPALNIEVADIVTIIGNLLDNALDAVAKVEDKRIKLDIEYSRESLFIQVENTFDGVVKCDTADNKRISTRKNSGEHGHGLKNIRKSVEKYNGHIDIAHDENIFTVTVLLYVDDMQMVKL